MVSPSLRKYRNSILNHYLRRTSCVPEPNPSPCFCGQNHLCLVTRLALAAGEGRLSFGIQSRITLADLWLLQTIFPPSLQSSIESDIGWRASGERDNIGTLAPTVLRESREQVRLPVHWCTNKHDKFF